MTAEGTRGGHRDRVDAFTQGRAIGVDAGAIERELADLWRNSTSAEGSAEGSVAIRACAWNLIVLVDAQRVQSTREVVDRLSQAVPTRTVLITPLSSEEEARLPTDHVSATVTARCQVSPSGGKLLCSEEITLEAAQTAGRHVAAIVRALLVPDVPTALYLDRAQVLLDAEGAQPALLRSALAGLADSVDRLVFDSRSWTVGQVLGAMSQRFTSAELADFAWLRDSYLRSALASLFDPPTGPDPLLRLSKLAIYHADGFGAAALLAGFVATQLGWRVEAGAILRVDGHPVELTLGGAPPPAAKPVYAHVELATTDAEKFTLTDLGDGTLVQCDSEACRRTQLHAALSVDALLRAALSARGRDRLYRRALDIAQLEVDTLRPGRMP